MTKYNEADFTENNYKNLLGKINTNTIFYDEIDTKNSFTLWRHDVDFSIHRAFALANVEKKMKIKATYFIQLGSFFIIYLKKK